MLKRNRKPQMTSVIRDSRDAKGDYELSLACAKQLYDEGKLSWDLTNGQFCHRKNDVAQPKFQES